jgi:hypothetical protein
VTDHDQESPPVVLGTCAADEGELYSALVLAESVRAFAGSMSQSPIRIYAPERLELEDSAIIAQLADLDADLRWSTAPAEALWLFNAPKVFAAAQAEEDAAAVGRDTILVWMGEDTVVLNEPREFLLPPSAACGYRPVMHNIIGSLFDQPPGPFWQRLYDRMGIPPAALFPMTTPADRQKIRAYFNAGLVVVKPARGVLRSWARHFCALYEDPAIVEDVRADVLKKVFLHQMALVGAILGNVPPSELVELSARYNYPIFFKEMFGAVEAFDSLTDVVTLRYDDFFRNPAPDWHKKLKGPADRIAWLKARLGRSDRRGTS